MVVGVPCGSEKNEFPKTGHQKIEENEAKVKYSGLEL